MTDEPLGEEPDPKTIRALADAAAMTGASCAACGQTLCGHEAVLCLVLGFKGSPRCLGCIAAHMEEDVSPLQERALAYVEHHACFLAAWSRAGELEGMGAVARPSCLWRAPDAGAAAPVAQTEPPAPSEQGWDAEWDAGGMGCGDLVLELRMRLGALAPGGLLRLRATDPGAPVDLPAWCSMTGHQMADAAHPLYLIRRKGG
jgi:tRNA 2-thiouridine synthesizing protein A